MMHKFCQECGTAAIEGNKVCINCGASLNKGTVSSGAPLSKEPVTKRTPKKAPMKKGQKTLGIILGAAIVLIIGFSVWANNYYSAESVGERFDAAIASKDAAGIKKLVVHEDGSTILPMEAEAFLKLVKVEGNGVVDKFSFVVKSGKFLGIYNKHKVEMIDQFAYSDQTDEALTFQFNGKKINEVSKSEEALVFGPIIPGIYDVEAIFSGEYGSTTDATKVQLADTSGIDQEIELDLLISKVVFTIADYNAETMKDATVLYKKEKFTVDEHGKTEEIGPFLIDGSETVQAAATMPWGEGVSIEVPIDMDDVVIESAIISDKAYEGILDMLKDYGEQESEEYVNLSAAGFTMLSEKYQAKLAEELSTMSDDRPFASAFNLLDVDKSSLKLTESGGIEIDARLHRTISYAHDSGDFIQDVVFTLDYDGANDTWLIANKIFDDYEDYTATDERKGSGVKHEADEAAITASNDESAEYAIGLFMTLFHEQTVESINARDFGYVEEYHTANGKSGPEARKYLDYLDSKGITQEHLGTTVENVEKIDDESFKVTSIDEFNIIQNGTSKRKKYRSVTIVKAIHIDYQMDELLSTKEI